MSPQPAQTGPLEIAAFTPADQGAVLDMILRIQREEFGLQITAQDQPDLSAIPDFYQVGAGDFWVAKIAGQVVGSIALKDIGCAQAALRKMFVAAPFRGAAFGVAQGLLDQLLTAARDRRLEAIYLGTTDRFLAAHRFYEKSGFTQIPKGALPAGFPLMAVDSRFYAIALRTEAGGAERRWAGEAQA